MDLVSLIHYRMAQHIYAKDSVLLVPIYFSFPLLFLFYPFPV